MSSAEQVAQGIDLWMKRVAFLPTKVFREMTWEVFTKILEHTPQWSGKAVANWNLSVGAPDYSWDPTLGDTADDQYAKRYSKSSTRAVGHRQWINVALQRNQHVLADIVPNKRVYMTNSVQGDDDKGKASTHYLEALQDSGYWIAKLRQVNQPYQTARETLIKFGQQRISLGDYLAPNIGGGSIDRYLA